MVCSLSPKERMDKIYEVVDLQEAKKQNQNKSPLTCIYSKTDCLNQAVIVLLINLFLFGISLCYKEVK